MAVNHISERCGPKRSLSAPPGYWSEASRKSLAEPHRPIASAGAPSTARYLGMKRVQSCSPATSANIASDMTTTLRRPWPPAGHSRGPCSLGQDLGAVRDRGRGRDLGVDGAVLGGAQAHRLLDRRGAEVVAADTVHDLDRVVGARVVRPALAAQ